jgi:hypothetical protein
MSSPTDEGKRVYFYDPTTNKIGHHTILNPSQRWTFPFTLSKSESSPITTVTADMIIILQPTTFVYGYSNLNDQMPSFTAAGSFLAESLNGKFDAKNTFIPSKVGIEAIEFRYYSPDNWVKFCRNRSGANVNHACTYNSGSTRLTITPSQNTIGFNSLVGTNPGSGLPYPPMYINNSGNDVTNTNIGGMTIFIVIFSGLLIIVTMTIAGMYSFGLFSQGNDVEQSSSEIEFNDDSQNEQGGT